MSRHKALVFLVEDDETLGQSLVQRLQLENYDVEWAKSASAAEKALSVLSPDVILSDIRLPDGDGETIMSRHFARSGLVPTIFMTAYGDIGQAVRLVRAGARDYLTKPFDLDALVNMIELAVAPVASGTDDDSAFGRSRPMLELRRTLMRVASLDIPVTLLGETGTGKEIAARFLHDTGARREKPFVAVNCGALSPDLAEATLFGHERGAFTGAATAHAGLAEEAKDGTLFLDEIGDLDLPMQVKLLRLIQEREYRRVGGTGTKPFHARIVCATNRDLPALVRDGSFREDLWFRINVVTCELPPLRARREDIVPLIQNRCRQAALRFGKKAPQVDPAAVAAGLDYSWPGNIRELVNRVDRAVALFDGQSITVHDLFPENATPNGETEREITLAQAREAAERQHITAAIEDAGGLLHEAARKLGVSRSTLWEKMSRYGIRAGDGDGSSDRVK